MANLVIKAPQLGIIDPILDVYFAKAQKDTQGNIKYERIEEAQLSQKIYIIIESNNYDLSRIRSLGMRLFVCDGNKGRVFTVQQNGKETDIINAKIIEKKNNQSYRAISEIELYSYDEVKMESLERLFPLKLFIELAWENRELINKEYPLEEIEKMKYKDFYWYRFFGKEKWFIVQQNNCFCNKNFTVEEVKKIVINLRENTFYNGASIYTFHQEKLFHRNNTTKKEYRNEIIPENERTFEELTRVLNKTFNKHKINTCIKKISFLAQMYIETAFFTSTIELDNKAKGYDPYRGRGFIQLTHLGNVDTRTNNATHYLGYKKYSGIDVVSKPEIISTSLDISADSAGWFWENGVRKNDGTLINLNKICSEKEEDFKKITKYVKGALTEFDERYSAFQSLLKIFRYEENCINYIK